MADSFGIFREDFTVAPAVQGILRGTPYLIKGKGFAQNIKKKALGDVSNTVSQKVVNAQFYDVPEKILANSCSGTLQEASVSCKPIVEKKETPQESPEICSCCHDFAVSDYDILPRSGRFSKKALEQFTTFNPRSNHSPDSSFEQDLSTSLVLMTPETDFSLDEEADLPLMDVSIPSLDDPDFSDVSF